MDATNAVDGAIPVTNVIFTNKTTNMNTTNDDATPTFVPTWQPGDFSSLAPTNLLVAKAQRAWDRRPQSPFSRTKVRFGKVWKRNNNASSSAHTTTSIFGNSSAFELVGRDSPVKAVKKMRMTGGGEMVSDWEGRGSPKNRRIVTRSNKNGEDLIALEKDEDELTQFRDEKGEVLKVEIEHEDGTVEEVGVEQELSHEDWDDESMTEEDPHGWDETLMHLAELREQQDAEDVQLQDDQKDASSAREDELEDTTTEVSTDFDVEATGRRPDDNGDSIAEPTVTVDEDNASQSNVSVERPSATRAAQSGPIPDGFVSPVKERRRRSIREAKQANANRRRTLPVNFAARPTTLPDVHIEFVPQVSEATPEVGSKEIHKTTENCAIVADFSVVETESDDDQWEDVGAVDEQSLRCYEVTPEVLPGEEWIPTVENTPENSPEMPYLQINPDITRLAEEQVALGKLPAIGDTSEPNPRLSMRRTPRRQSSSPLKRNKTRDHAEESHLVAFTPIKMLRSGLRSENAMIRSPAQLPSSPDLLEKTNLEDSNLTRSSSAPPEEPQMSPRRPPQPRMSDDTATLQAFINRAAQSKNDRRLSETAKRESLENRRESNTVRQALASPVPAPAEVLATLDPNSPSPHKQASPALVKYVTDEIKAQDEEDELAASSPTTRSSRRSGRTRKKSESLPSTTYSGPTKISVRGTTDGVVLKKSEAQEMAQRTRNNTRKNKGTAVLPRLRLTRMAQEGDVKNAASSAAPADDEKPTKIRWAETLASFYAGGNEPEISMMTDELVGVDAEAADDDTIAVSLEAQPPSMPPPNETPSKPKIRRLKPTRTASTLEKNNVQDDAREQPVGTDEIKIEQLAEKKPRTATRRYRIATPAKPRDPSNLSFLADDVAQRAEEAPKKAPSSSAFSSSSTSAAAPAAPQPAAGPAPAKKKVVSRLPAPVSVGKENSLIASPPKKKVTRTPATTKSASVTKSIPKLDFADRRVDETLGIASPAKKGIKAQVLGAGAKESRGPTLPPGLGSPAKKRARRMAS